ncbi:hypothetical protein K488DRAFT_50830, partial [Vararia minispora EC-137]
FGKQLQAEIIPGWSEYYLDYKFLKKIVSSLASNRPATEAAALALGIRVRPADLLSQSPHVPAVQDAVSMSIDEPPIVGNDDDYRGPDFQAHKAAFFFKLERELEKINAFYLRKEAELKLRLETLLSKRRAAASHVLPDGVDDTTQNYVEWKAVEEGFRLLERDLAKLQRFIEINATGFRKILKKWDKRSKSTTKELYLARQVDVQPVFNRQLISELADIVAACLVDITDVSVGQNDEAVSEIILGHQFVHDGGIHMALYRDLESNLRKAVLAGDEASVRQLVMYTNTLDQRTPSTGAAGGSAPAQAANITRVLWKTVVDAPPALADLVLVTTTKLEWSYVDDINGRTLLHEAAIAGALRLVELCIEHGVSADITDVYGRSSLHYAAMHGHADVVRQLLHAHAQPSARDMESYSPLVYATLRGSVDCVRVLLVEGGVHAHPSPDDHSDLLPLALASLAGHLDVVVLLLEHGARSVPSSNGEYPIHFAARQGHADVVSLLVRLEGWDTPDKFSEWTPLFHAVRFGHINCVRALLQAGARSDAADEMGNRAMHYAAWYGHYACAELLREAAVRVPAPEPIVGSPAERSTGSSQLRATDSDTDLIPSLTLPPPMMPHRVYGHNYLDKQTLVQVTIGRAVAVYSSLPDQPPSAVRLHPRLMGSGTVAETALLTAPLLKLVMMASPAAVPAPYSVTLPIGESVNVFAFQTPALSQLSLEFSLYPNFGTKTIGRAILAPELINSVQGSNVITLPILDTRLHVIAEVTFEIHIISPFSGVTLEIGGAVETYWKSLGNKVTEPPPRRQVIGPVARLVRAPRPHPPASAQVSPTGSVAASVTGPTQTITVTSVTGRYVHLTIQVTRDMHPVVYAERRLPEDAFDLSVDDVTRAQFEALAVLTGRDFSRVQEAPTSPVEWYQALRDMMIPLDVLLATLPGSMWLCLELVCSLTRNSPLNASVDSVLRTVYHTITPADGRRKIIFTSFSPDVCMAINWKQPNCILKLTSLFRSRAPFSDGGSVGRDWRVESLSAVVEFARSNNLLGVIGNANLLVCSMVPSLARAVRDAGLLVGTYGNVETVSALKGDVLDASLQGGVLTFHDPPARAW